MPMAHLDPHQTDLELDAVLRRTVVAPDPAWATALEEDLLPAQRRRAAPWRLPQLRVGAALAAGLAALLVALALAGVAPLGGDSSNVRAKEDCTLVRVTRVEREPVVVEGPAGTSVTYQRTRVQRWARRCR
jgi:hypothetical protein